MDCLREEGSDASRRRRSRSLNAMRGPFRPTTGEAFEKGLGDRPVERVAALLAGGRGSALNGLSRGEGRSGEAHIAQVERRSFRHLLRLLHPEIGRING